MSGILNLDLMFGFQHSMPYPIEKCSLIVQLQVHLCSTCRVLTAWPVPSFDSLTTAHPQQLQTCPVGFVADFWSPFSNLQEFHLFRVLIVVLNSQHWLTNPCVWPVSFHQQRADLSPSLPSNPNQSRLSQPLPATEPPHTNPVDLHD